MRFVAVRSSCLNCTRVFMLISRVGRDETAVAAMRKGEAIAGLQDYRIDG